MFSRQFLAEGLPCAAPPWPTSFGGKGIARKGGLCSVGCALAVGDDMAEFAIDFLLTGRGTARQLVHILAERWPDHPALEYVLTLSLAASGIESTLTGEEAASLSRDAWRMAALIGVDLYDAQALGLPHFSGTDLQAYWQDRDPFFLAD